MRRLCLPLLEITGIEFDFIFIFLPSHLPHVSLTSPDQAGSTRSVWAFIKEEFKCCSLGNCQNRWLLFSAPEDGEQTTKRFICFDNRLCWRRRRRSRVGSECLRPRVMPRRKKTKRSEDLTPNFLCILFEGWNAVAIATQQTGGDGVWQLARVSLTCSILDASMRDDQILTSSGYSESHPLAGWFNQ